MWRFWAFLLLFYSAIYCVEANAQRLPQLYHLADTYAVVILPDANGEFVARETGQFLLSDHMLVQTYLLNPQFEVDVMRDGEIQTHELFIFNKVSDPVLRFRLIEKKQLDYGYIYSAQLETNVPEQLVHSAVVIVDGDRLPVKVNTPFTVESYANSLTMTGQVEIARYKQISHTQTWEHQLPEQLACDIIYDPPVLEAVCFSNREPILATNFTLDEFPIGRHGKVTIGESIPPDLVMHVHLPSGVHDYAFIVDESGVTTQRLNHRAD